MDAQQEFLPELDIARPERIRRLTVAFRLILAIPQFVVLFVLTIGAVVVLVCGWFGALVLGRLPAWVARSLTDYVLYSMRLNAYLYLLTDRYPPFSFDDGDYPVQIELQPGPLNRAAVFFRIILVIPASIVASVAGSAWEVFAFFFWLVELITGRVPNTIFAVSTAMLRYQFRFQAYFFMLSSAYPKRLLGDGAPGEAHAFQTSGTRPLLLNGNARALLIIMLVIGAIFYAYQLLNPGAFAPVPTRA
jgi:hypothetical protein